MVRMEFPGGVLKVAEWDVLMLCNVVSCFSVVLGCVFDICLRQGTSQHPDKESQAKGGRGRFL